jgi:tyrosyl-tRNA synthetase
VTASSGRKVSKSEGNAVFLDPTRTSPYEFYQFWVNTEDVDVERYLAIYTFLPIDEVRALGRLEGADLRRAKEVLAWEVTAVVHGEQAANEARETSQSLFKDSATGSSQATMTGSISPTGEITSMVLRSAAPITLLDQSQVQAGISIVELLTVTGLAESKRRARTLIVQKGVRLNEQDVLSPDRVVTLDDFLQDAKLDQQGIGILDRWATLQRGQKTFHRVAISPVRLPDAQTE